MSVTTNATLLKRLDDLNVHSGSQAAQLGGASNEDWVKFNRNGGGAPASDDYTLDSEYWRGLFTRDVLNSDYVAAVDSGVKFSQIKAELAKVQAELLQTMQRGTVMRYTRSRIWASAAAATRLHALNISKQTHRIATVVDGKGGPIQ